MFFTLVLSGVLVMSLYVGWRAGCVPTIARRLPRWPRAALLALLGSSYVLARYAERAGWPGAARVLELAGAHWIGVLLLLFVCLLAADLLTGFGLFFRRRLPSIRAWAIVAAAALSAVALVQGNRPPVVRDYEVRLAGLPSERDGTVLVFVSDLHLGSLLGKRWLEARLDQISALRPDAILVGGDVLEGDSPSERDLLPLLGRLSAPLGVWAVAGNHEHHGGGSALAALEGLGFRALRNEWREMAPGLVVAGIDGGGRGADDDRANSTAPPAGQRPTSGLLARALAGRPAPSATVLVSHMPARVGEAAAAEVGLMLSGHTYGGQLWPFGYIVRTQFPYLAGRYQVGATTLVVCRGTGTFGPRMRLWHPGEIVRVTIRSR
jgi:predicted MPP superfamily phosphohydrolase